VEELEDKIWFPNYLRQQQTEYIGWLVCVFKLYEPIAAKINEAASKKGNSIKDVGSGSGGPWLSLSKLPIFQKTQIKLTDKFPQPSGIYPPNITYETVSFNPLIEEFSNNELLTFFNAFHHFSDIEKQEIIGRALAQNNSIFIAEILSPSFIEYFKILFTTTIVQYILAPFVKPFRLSRLFFTWIIPLNIFTVTYDGLISVYKCRKNRHMESFCKSLPFKNGYDAGKTSSLFGKVYYMHIW